LDAIPFFSGKKQSVDLIQKYPQLTWTAVITGIFFDYGFPVGFFDIHAKEGKATIWDDGNVKFTTTNLDLIGRTLAKLLTDPAAYEDSKNKYIFTESYTTTQNEVLAVTEKVTGKKFEVTKVDGKETWEAGVQKVKAGDMSGIFPAIQGLAFANINGEGLSDHTADGFFNTKYGITDEPLEVVVQRLVGN
jgi:hypothetical protein